MLGVNSSVPPQPQTLETELDMSGVSDHLQLRLEATPSLEAAKLTKMLEAALAAENHNTADALDRCRKSVAEDTLVGAVGGADALMQYQHSTHFTVRYDEHALLI